MAAAIVEGTSVAASLYFLRVADGAPPPGQAAMFGRAFLDLYNPIDLVNMAQTLKVLNAVRYYEIGIPITYDQFVFLFAPPR